ncbi:glycosyltransferase family 28 domain-containing protein [Colletotrichum scovillei]|nr:glycosyltransferase family 28 domain-containing protein [Colletotrichum scovillei]
MRCGKLLRGHSCNIRRHQQRCHACLRKPVGTGTGKVPSMTKPRRSERLSQHVQQVTTARAVDGTPAQDEPSGCVTPNEVYLHAPENQTRDTSYDDGVNAPLHDPILDTIYAYPFGFPGGDFTWTGPFSTWDEVTNTTPQDPGAGSIHSDPSS